VFASAVHGSDSGKQASCRPNITVRSTAHPICVYKYISIYVYVCIYIYIYIYNLKIRCEERDGSKKYGTANMAGTSKEKTKRPWMRV